MSHIALRRVEYNKDVLVPVLVEKEYAAKQRSVRIERRTDLLYRERADVRRSSSSITFRPVGPEMMIRDDTSVLVFLTSFSHRHG
jgi:hypothetical protein